MIALELVDVKDFMNKLLRSEIFDNFLLQEATIINGPSYVVDGRIQKNYYTHAELEEMGIDGYPAFPFSMLRNQCFDLIKGKRAIKYFKFVFMLSPENLEKTIASSQSSYRASDITGVFLNLRYQSQQLVLTTGISYKVFSVDKSLEQEWDVLIKKFLKQHEIPFEEL